MLFTGGGYRIGYAVLLGSAALAIIALVVARRTFPVPARLEQAKTTRPDRFGHAYWWYMAAGACFAAGLLSFEVVTFHLAKSLAVATSWIPVLLALSTGLGVLASLALGKLYDRFGTVVVGAAIAISASFTPLVFAGDRVLLVISMLPWGIAYATQDTLFKAIVAGLLPQDKRNLAFGLFYAGYGDGLRHPRYTAGCVLRDPRCAAAARRSRESGDQPDPPRARAHGDSPERRRQRRRAGVDPGRDRCARRGEVIAARPWGENSRVVRPRTTGDPMRELRRIIEPKQFAVTAG